MCRYLSVAMSEDVMRCRGHGCVSAAAKCVDVCLAAVARCTEVDEYMWADAINVLLVTEFVDE